MNGSKLARPARQDSALKINRDEFLKETPRTTAVVPAGPIKTALIDLNGAVTQLHESISRVENTFEPVLHSAEESGGNAAGAPESSCPHARLLHDLIRGIRAATDRIDALSNRSAL